MRDINSFLGTNRKPDDQRRNRARFAQRKTIAGSSRITFCTLRRLDRTQIRTIAAAVIGSNCQGVKKASSVPLTRHPNKAARPTPIP